MSGSPVILHPDHPVAPPRIRLGVLGSGAGTNFTALAEAIQRGELEAEIAVVISDVVNAPLLEKARERKIPAVFIDPGPFQTKFGDPAQAELVRCLIGAQVDCVICAGFMRRLKDPVLKAFPNRILNVHPSLLPQFAGRDGIGQALTAGVAETGCTVHLVNEEIDAGDILAQEKVPILPGDTHATLLARVHAAEHRLYPRTIGAYLRKLSFQR
jgi:phosphoribosylglycinamide formyltransferase-1